MLGLTILLLLPSFFSFYYTYDCSFNIFFPVYVTSSIVFSNPFCFIWHWPFPWFLVTMPLYSFEFFPDLFLFMNPLKYLIFPFIISFPGFSVLSFLILYVFIGFFRFFLDFLHLLCSLAMFGLQNFYTYFIYFIPYKLQYRAVSSFFLIALCIFAN